MHQRQQLCLQDSSNTEHLLLTRPRWTEASFNSDTSLTTEETEEKQSSSSEE